MTLLNNSDLTKRHLIVREWLAGESDAGGCISALEQKLLVSEDLLNRAAMAITPGSLCCGRACHIHEIYGFTPEAGCPIHD